MALKNRAWYIGDPSKHTWDEIMLQERPIPETLDDHAVLVHWHYACLNYRDLIIPLGKYPFPIRHNVALGSDAAGTIVRTGAKVSLFHPGDHVLPLPAQNYQTAPFKFSMVPSILGSSIDGVFQEYSVLNERGLVSMPSTLDFKQGSTLPTAALTAWNALFGLEGKKLQKGQWVLCQGTGGTSVAALQMAKAIGANVIATSSSLTKCERLRGLGADHVINYREMPDWGEEARRLTGGEGVAHVIEIGGTGTLKQSLEAIGTEGVVNVIGFVSGSPDELAPSMMEALLKCCIVRGVINGSREQFVEMNVFLERHRIQPAIDEKEFAFEDMKEAFQYLWDGKHFGKVAVKI